MAGEGHHLVEHHSTPVSEARGPEADEGSPSGVGFAEDGPHGGDTGEVHQNEQQVGEGPNAAIKAGDHLAKGGVGNGLFGGGGV